MMKLLSFKPIELVPHGTKFSFVAHQRLAIIETVVLAVVTVALLLTMGLNFGIDFRGGTMMEVRFTKAAPDLAELRSSLAAEAASCDGSRSASRRSINSGKRTPREPKSRTRCAFPRV